MAWPQHPDGRNKTIGEMTPDERRIQIEASLERLRPEIEQAAASIVGELTGSTSKTRVRP